MISINDISEGITAKIRNSLPDIDDQKAETIEYGIYMAISEITKITLIIIISLIFGITKYVVGTIVIVGMPRLYIGGIHADTHIKCFLSTSIMTFSITLISMNVKIDNLIFASIALPFCLLIISKYAPADNPNKPIKSKKQRRSLRIKGIILIIIYFIAGIFLKEIWANILDLAAVSTCVMITPVLYKLFRNKYGSEGVNT